jgi:hypothetical protein
MGSVVEMPHFASNHPQSLWITLWSSFRRNLQVTYRKGFFFFRSIFERTAFYNGIIGLRVLSLWSPVRLGEASFRGRLPRRPVDRRIRRVCL